MSDLQPAPRPVRLRPAPIPVVVSRVERLRPRFVRVTFALVDPDRFTWPGAGSHLKVFLPQPGETEVLLPEPDAEGMVNLAAAGPLTSRTYTPRRFDPERGELDIDFVLHGHGPAARWAAAVRPGDRAAVSIPRASYQPDPAAAALIVAGDESALPAIATILEACPPHLPITVLAEVRDATDQLLLPDGGAVTVAWLARGDAPAGSLLERELAAIELPTGVRVWVATEATVVRRIRGVLLDKHGLAREAMVTRGYWRVDTANHPDHDFGDDEIPTR